MRLLILSGRSGSGKSTALHVFEDVGFNCIDNLPASLLPALVAQFQDSETGTAVDLAVSIDARNPASDLEQFPAIHQQILDQNILCEVIFLDARDEILVQRFSETRRKHPLSNPQTDLNEAIHREQELLAPIKNLADYTVDTSQMQLYDLRDLIFTQVSLYRKGRTAIQIQSFGFKHGVPVDADFVFDVRCLPNPHWEKTLRPFTGLDQPVIDFLEQQSLALEMADDIADFLIKWLPHFIAGDRSYLTVAIGCTGGQHRSVFVSQRIQSKLEKRLENVQIRHRELKQPASQA